MLFKTHISILCCLLSLFLSLFSICCVFRSQLAWGQHQETLEVLEVSQSANAREITKAYFKQAKIVHPDKNHSPHANEDFQALKDIYDILKNPSSRMAYNCRLRKQQQNVSNADPYFFHSVREAGYSCRCVEDY